MQKERVFETFSWKYHLPRVVFILHIATKAPVCRGRPLMHELQFEQPVWYNCRKSGRSWCLSCFWNLVFVTGRNGVARLIWLRVCTFNLPCRTRATRRPSLIALSLRIRDRQAKAKTQLHFWTNAELVYFHTLPSSVAVREGGGSRDCTTIANDSSKCNPRYQNRDR